MVWSLQAVGTNHRRVVTMEYGIRNVPTVIFIKDGKVVDKFVGSKSKGEVQAKFEALL